MTGIQSRTLIGVILAILLAATSAGIGALLATRPAAAQSPGVTAPVRQVTVVGQGEITARPDIATVQIGVETEAPNAQEALAQNSAAAQAVQERIAALGIATKDIQTANFAIAPIYGNDGRQVTGYRVSNSVTVIIRNLDGAGALLDQVVQAGANNIYGISFSIDDPQALLDQAREQAITDARARAETLAQSSGATIGQVLVITENIGSAVPLVPVMVARAEVAAMPAPIQPGEQTLSVAVQVTYELR